MIDWFRTQLGSYFFVHFFNRKQMLFPNLVSTLVTDRRWNKEQEVGTSESAIRNNITLNLLSDRSRWFINVIMKSSCIIPSAFYIWHGIYEVLSSGFQSLPTFQLCFFSLLLSMFSIVFKRTPYLSPVSSQNHAIKLLPVF